MMEVWKAVEGFEGFYEVSTVGCVRSLRREVCYTLNGREVTKVIKERTLKIKQVSGYSFVTLCKNGVKEEHSLHRLVAIAFLGHANFQDAVVMHLDDNTKNNRLENLKWGSNKDNSQDMVAKNRQSKGDDHGRSVLTEEQIPKIREFRRIGMSSRKVAEIFGVSKTTIDNVHSGKTWSHVI